MTMFINVFCKKKKYLIKFVLILIFLHIENSFAQTSNFSFPVIDQLMCGFILYSKSRLAPYVAVLSVMIGVIGHWLGVSRIWNLLLYVSMGLGLIMGIGSVVITATGASASCLIN